ncbi:MAG: hypothetical protein RJB38_702 [Pseudomonadota bacterium]|jgi:hypothetical protein
MSPIYSRRIRNGSALFATLLALALSAWLASQPGQAEDAPLGEIDLKKPVTCTDAAGILYERGTPGFERCWNELNAPQPEQAARVDAPPKSPFKKKASRR